MDRAVTTARQPVAIAIGSNLGNRQAAIAFAIERLSRFLTAPTFSSIVETEPIAADGSIVFEQSLFLNAVVTGTTELAPRDLLEQLLAIEADFGRERPYPGAARTLDLDLILYGDLVIDAPDLVVPHPRFRSRFFVLGPLVEVGPAMIDPVSGLTVAELLRRLLSEE